jgi:hypothetical protein
MSLTPQQQLDSVQAAIAALEANPASQIKEGDRMVTYADLKTLYDREAVLLGRVSRAANGGGARVRRISPRG